MRAFNYTFGIEEEYFLGSARTGSLATQVPKDVLAGAIAELGDTVTAELLQSQIEIASPIFHDCREAHASMSALRVQLARIVASTDLQLIAASTHPFGAWRQQVATEKPRYGRLMSDFRIVGQRNLVCGMHVHVAVPPDVDRVALMNRAMPWLPVFLALSTSSPFWQRRVTGLLSYRQAIYDEWPRSGIPDFFEGQPDYDAFTALMQNCDAVKDSSYFWWAIRPALRFPTLEMRIADVCTRVEDGLALAALYRCLIATLIERPDLGAHRTTHTRRIIDENRWRAKRDGTSACLIDEQAGENVPISALLDRLFALVGEAAERFGCCDWLDRLRDIVAQGTSAHVQLRIYNDARAAGDTGAQSLRRVVDWLAQTTACQVKDAESVSHRPSANAQAADR